MPEAHAKRPVGVVVIVCLFAAFSAADVVAQLLSGSDWWVVSLCLSLLLVYLFRKLWVGDERERKIAVFFGFFVATLSALSLPAASMHDWPAEEYVWMLEGLYALCAALYLLRVRNHPFFAPAAR